MSQKNPIVDQFVPRVEGRTTLARTLLRGEHAGRVGSAGLLARDLDAIVQAGERAKAYDGAQREQLAEQRQSIAAGRNRWNEFLALVEAFRMRAPLVVRDLATQPETASLGVWLDNDVFARFRIRTLTGGAEGGAAEPEAPARKRVTRVDRYSFAVSMEQLLSAVLNPEREAIVAAFAARGLPREKITELHSEASEFAATLGGNRRLTEAEATRLEAEAVAEQKRAWEACRRAIRAAIGGHPELERLYAAC